MRIWYDWEFVEWGAGRPLVPLSLGMVREDGKEFYRQFVSGLEDAMMHPWVSENVVPQLEKCVSGNQLGCGCLTYVVPCPWRKTTEDVKDELIEFCGPRPELWGYYADYDHVLFSQIFGRMIDLPEGFPMYTLDIIQEAKMRQAREGSVIWLPPQGKGEHYAQGKGEHHALLDARWNKLAWDFLFPGGLPSLRG